VHKDGGGGRLFSGIIAILIFIIANIAIGCKQLNNNNDKKHNAPLSQQIAETCTITLSVLDGNGSLKATVDGTVIDADVPVKKGSTVVFRAAPAQNYAVENWLITGGEVLSGGKAGDITAKVKITANITVKVTFSLYKKVSFANLDGYLCNTASPIEINYIEVTGLKAEDLKGDSSHTSPLGKILKNYSTKKISIKFGGSIEGLTDMSFCFRDCTSLVYISDIPVSVTNLRGCFWGCKNLKQSPHIPNGVTNMHSCFSFCINLEQAPYIPASVTNMRGCFSVCTNLKEVPNIPAHVTDMYWCFFRCTSLVHVPAIPASVTNLGSCFFVCTKLTSVTFQCDYNDTGFKDIFKNCTVLAANSIKVPAGQLERYRNNAATMKAKPEWFH